MRPVKSSTIIEILTKHYGYVHIRTKGSHAYFEDGKGHRTTVLLYPELWPKAIKFILDSTGLK